MGSRDNSGRSRIFKRRLLILQNFSSELFEDQKKKEKIPTSFYQLNLASNNTPSLTPHIVNVYDLED